MFKLTKISKCPRCGRLVKNLSVYMYEPVWHWSAKTKTKKRRCYWIENDGVCTHTKTWLSFGGMPKQRTFRWVERRAV